MAFVGAVTYLKEVVHFRSGTALDINSINMTILLILVLAAGALSDWVGRNPLLVAGSLGLVVLAWPLFWLLHHPDGRLIFVGQMGFAVLGALYGGAIPVAMVEAFPSRVRCSAISIGYNLSLGIFGGTTPLVAAYLIERSHYDLSPVFYLLAAAGISLAVGLCMRETARVPLQA
jgi:MHS family proline/betaine transporter-like MFS transporter